MSLRGPSLYITDVESIFAVKAKQLWRTYTVRQIQIQDCFSQIAANLGEQKNVMFFSNESGGKCTINSLLTRRKWKTGNFPDDFLSKDIYQSVSSRNINYTLNV